MQYASGYNIDRLKAMADVIDESSDKLTTYMGFCSSGTTSEDQAAWSILKITSTTTDDTLPNKTTFVWATGQCSYNLVYADRAGYDYTFKKF
jgi:hypothetical protein